ncbi:rRNA maturation RNase YbeY [Salibacterium salarium]|uniref:Endoribonuclease YbeY n=1 Tax=Salibacterium salarium TaxID=284579 RepID=A0A428MXN0_9BACI|nr:rRNA maturation RNase YbeY [Salibacterium salarium]RSL30894.1 rRNA maturation RNase YbeY [Salibacterium salarium]
MSVIIDIIDETETVTYENTTLIKNLLQYAAKQEQISDGTELSVTIVDNDSIQAINNQYRGLDKPTDVISFALNEDEEEEVYGEEDMPNLLGDIVISIDKAEEQASSYGHSLEREIGFLAVHGLLHLLGYTHDRKESESEMFSRQELILNEYGLER